MVAVHVLRVFTDPEGRWGNPLAVFLDGAAIPEQMRLAVAAELGYSETVFVDDVNRAEVRIFSPESEFAFAGHPLVGTAWLLAHEGKQPSILRPPAGEVMTWTEGNTTWISGRPEWAPPWEQIQLDQPETVASMRNAPSSEHDLTQFWAWEDKAHGIVRARVFAARIGVHEDEACGSASMLLAHRAGQAITVRHGEGSRISARPGPNGNVEIGGLVVLDHAREYRLAT
jgi:predicted PhzF superfamily epimerase YddE/YHI9